MLTYDLRAKSYQFPSELHTSFSGIRALNSFYHHWKDEVDQHILLDFSCTTFFDANLSSLLLAMIYKLSTENRLSFHVDASQIKKDLHVLIRNGLIKTNSEVLDDRKSTVSCKYFTSAQLTEFKDYVEVDLFQHRAFAKILPDVKQAVVNDLLEVFNNYIQHSKSAYPFFVCGQYFPRDKKLMFTMSDLGVGFLPAISKFTEGKVIDALDSIRWAVAGNSTKPNQEEMPAGLGLEGIKDYCLTNKGCLQIATGDGYWETSCVNSNQHIGMNFTGNTMGTVINIHFAC
ncbi:hypothetical protein [Dyadobacter sp. CY323]|uniref:hypothetical protein n=1 Tax=Dyadobacter sp. CY323 TaxID=2907302 RepID=UPI001F238ED7|nr:hypothetical protein [Dyadobacter sp. CY323]MCE6989023.1 hypothetical protein [Dyadobacter sp. CY323]